MRNRFVAFAAALLPSLAFLSPALADAACKPALAASIDLAIGPHALGALAPVKINDRQTYLLVDTGGIVSTLRYDVAEDLNLPMEDAPSRMVNVVGQQLDRQATVQRFELGALHYSNAKFMLEPEYNMAGGLLGAVSGTLSPDVLRNFDVEIDLAAAKMNLFTPSTCANPAYWNPTGATAVKLDVAENGHILFPMQLDGKPIQALLDTGMSYTTIDLAAARERFGVDTSSRDVERAGRLAYTDESQIYRYQFNNLAFPNSRISLDKPSIRLMPNLAPSAAERPSGDAELVVGLSTVQSLHIYIAYKRGVLFVTPASGPPATYHGPDIGIPEPNSLRAPPQ